MRVRRLRKRAAELEVTAFINLVVVLVPFLLSTAVFTRLSVLELTLPAQSSSVEQLKVEDLKLEIVLRPDALEVGDRIGGLIQRLPNPAAAAQGMAQRYDTASLSALLLQIKTKFPAVSAASILAQPDTAYETLVQVMDAARETQTAGSDGKGVQRVALFPDLSIGDAPRSTLAEGKR